MVFGCILCFDCFLYVITILPLRVGLAVWQLIQEFHFLPGVTKTSSRLASSQTADFKKSGLIIFTLFVLRNMDASLVYHSIRGQSSIKLYVLYNVLEILDKLACAIGQDILDFLILQPMPAIHISESANIIRSIGVFILGLLYNALHTSILFYQAVTLNVAVNSHSHALLALLMSNQMVEIKGTVFKKFEKENLFQITCADIVERFQLCLLLCTIVGRNFLEYSGTTDANSTVQGWLPIQLRLVIDTIVIPIMIVLGSEVMVDWLKHSFITKFNHIRPSIYSRFEDVLCRDYATFGNNRVSNGTIYQSPEISRRIGLPTIPLVCIVLKSISQALQSLYAGADTSEPINPGGIYSSAQGSVNATEGVSNTFVTLPSISLVLNTMGLWVLRVTGVGLVYCG